MHGPRLKGIFGRCSALAPWDFIRPERIRTPLCPPQIFSGVDRELLVLAFAVAPCINDVGREALAQVW